MDKEVVDLMKDTTPYIGYVFMTVFSVLIMYIFIIAALAKL
jgi:hypothetical protein